MAIIYTTWFVGSVVLIAATVYLLLTHFGILLGADVVSPVLFGLAATLYAASVPFLRARWFVLIGIFAFVAIFAELIFRFNLWGLAGGFA